jgi:chitosanase
MQVTERQKHVIENIITLHETGRINNKSYGMVVNVRGDPGGLTYGKHQVTINSGGLYLMLKRYCDHPQARFGNELRPWLLPIRSKNHAVVASPKLRDILTFAGDDPVMVQVQDSYFDDQYWNPADRFCEAKGFQTALAMAIVYDSTIHGSLFRIDKRLPPGLPEHAWMLKYVQARRHWMATHPTIPILHHTVYRMDTFLRLLQENNFDLNSPVFANGRRADIGELNNSGNVPPVQRHEQPNVEVPIGATSQRIIDFGDRGADVQECQNMLLRIGYNIGRADGVFGQKTLDAVVAFQRLYNLTPDGIVGPATWRTLDQVDD